MRTISIIALMFVVAGCTGCQPEKETSKPRAGHVEYVKGSYVLTPEADFMGAPYYTYTLRLRMVFDGGYAGVAQELSAASLQYTQRTALEFTPRQAGWDWMEDQQNGGRGDVRTGKVYAAVAANYDLEGALMAILERNLDGSFVADPANRFINRQEKGAVTRAGSAVEWRLEARADGVHLFIDGEEIPLD